MVNSRPKPHGCLTVETCQRKCVSGFDRTESKLHFEGVSRMFGRGCNLREFLVCSLTDKWSEVY